MRGMELRTWKMIFSLLAALCFLIPTTIAVPAADLTPDEVINAHSRLKIQLITYLLITVVISLYDE